ATQNSGSVALTECSMGYYPKSLVADPTSTATVAVSSTGQLKVYTAGPSGGSFANVGSNSVFNLIKYNGTTVDATSGQPSASLGAAGVTMDTISVETDKIGVAPWDMFGGSDEYPRTTATRQISARVEAGKIYKARFHATATVAANRQPTTRFRVKTAGFD